MKVFVYYNLHRKCWSVKAMEGPRKGFVVAHEHFLILKDCTYKVSEAGRQRVLRTKRKAVHAGIVGTLVRNENLKGRCDRVSYNPYKGPDFVKVDDGSPIKASTYAAMSSDRSVYAYTI